MCVFDCCLSVVFRAASVTISICFACPQEALAFALSLKRLQLSTEGFSVPEVDVHAALLADLQEIQNKECKDTMTSVVDMVS